MERVANRTPIPVIATVVKKISDVTWNMVPADPKSEKSILIAQAVETDFYQEIQAEKDNCGFALMRRLIQCGQATPENFKDDGKRLDTTVFPEERCDAVNAARDPDMIKLVQEMGLNGSTDNLEELVTKKLKAIVAEHLAKTSEKAPEKAPAVAPKEESNNG